MSENPNYQQNPGEFIPAPQQAPAYNMQGGYPGYQPKPGSGLDFLLAWRVSCWVLLRW